MNADLMIMWHKFMMARSYDYDRNLCRHHMDKMIGLIKARNG